MPRRRQKRSRYSRQHREGILATAAREGLTAKDVQNRFGVVPGTYYAWRERAKATAVIARIARQLPRILDQEVKRYFRGLSMGKVSRTTSRRPPRRRSP
jgi:transposase-like protein